MWVDVGSVASAVVIGIVFISVVAAAAAVVVVVVVVGLVVVIIVVVIDVVVAFLIGNIPRLYSAFQFCMVLMSGCDAVLVCNAAFAQ